MTAVQRRVTSLGPALELHGGIWTLDLSELPVLQGLSVLSKALGDMALEQIRAERLDVNIIRKVLPEENPELIGMLGVTRVMVCADHATVAPISNHPEVFHDHLRAVFGTIQRKQYRDALFAAQPICKALVFSFEFPDHQPCRAILERVAAQSEGRCYLRLTIEDPQGRRMDLNSIPHLEVSDLERRTFIAGTTRMARSWCEWLIREAERGRRSFSEKRSASNHLFRSFEKARLNRYDEMLVSWRETFQPQILESDPAVLYQLLKRALLSLEDAAVRSVLHGGGVVRIVYRDLSLYIDEGHSGAMLNFSLGHRRDRIVLDSFLDKMPALRGVLESADPLPLRGVSLFLIHHLTAEVLGLIAALRHLGCQDLVTVFVAYSDTPRSLVAPLLDLPQDEFRCLSLINVQDGESVEGHYRLSNQFSPIGPAAEISDLLAANRVRYFEAMQTVACFEFVQQLRRAGAAGDTSLIIEDGGYLAPHLNAAALDGLTVQQLMLEKGIVDSDTRLLSDLLCPTLAGSVEHTRNGFDRLQDVQNRRGRLHRPSVSIAISRLKVEVEAAEVATSILNAVENVLGALGKVLSRRRCIVLGSRGAIGGSLIASLKFRLQEPQSQLGGVDIKILDDSTLTERFSFDELPLEFRQNTGLIIGVIGCSILTGEHIEEWLLTGVPRELYLVSGSTKTEEFSQVAAWLDTLLQNAEPELRGHPARIEVSEVEDPLTGRILAHEYRFTMEFRGGIRQRSLILISGLKPVNFLFYGVPTEVIDEVLAELLACSLGLLKRSQDLSPRLYAVDLDVTTAGEPLIGALVLGLGPV